MISGGVVSCGQRSEWGMSLLALNGDRGVIFPPYIDIELDKLCWCTKVPVEKSLL